MAEIVALSVEQQPQQSRALLSWADTNPRPMTCCAMDGVFRSYRYMKLCDKSMFGRKRQQLEIAAAMSTLKQNEPPLKPLNSL